jgi:hypothetical protein
MRSVFRCSFSLMVWRCAMTLVAGSPQLPRLMAPSNVIKAEDSKEDSSEVNNEAARSDTDISSVILVTATKASNPETTIVRTAPHLAIPSQYNPLADGLAGVPTKDSRTVNAVEREVFIKQLTNIVHSRNNLVEIEKEMFRNVQSTKQNNFEVFIVVRFQCH